MYLGQLYNTEDPSGHCVFQEIEVKLLSVSPMLREFREHHIKKEMAETISQLSHFLGRLVMVQNVNQKWFESLGRK